MKVQRLRRVIPAAAVVLAGLVSFQADTARAAAELLPYFSPDFCFAIVIHPEQIGNSTLAQALKSALPQQKTGDPTAAAKAMLKTQKNLPPGMDLEKLAKLLKDAPVKRVVIVVNGVPVARGPSGMDVGGGLIVQFSKEVDGESIVSATSSEWKEVEIAGHKCKTLKTEDSSEIVAVVPDTRTLIAGHRTTVEKMLGQNTGDRPLLKQLQRSSLKHDILIEFCAAPTRSERAKVTGKPSDLLNSLSQLAQTAESLSLQVDFSGPSLMHCELTTDKPEKAAMLATMGKSQIEVAKQQFAALKQSPLIPPTLAPAASKLGDEVLGGVEIKSDGPKLTVDLPTPDSLSEALVALAKLAPTMMPPGAGR